MKTSEVLNRAADLIEERGWGRGTASWNNIGDDSAPLCLEGGIMAALGLTIDLASPESAVLVEVSRCPAYKAVTDYLGTVVPFCHLWRWNDGVAQSAEEVIATLRAAAVIEAAKESADDRVPVAVS